MTALLPYIVAAVLGAGLLALSSRYIGFRSQRPAEFSGKGPSFDPRTHLSGPILCEGIIYGPLGRVTSSFVAEMEGVWDGNRGVLKERFRYDNGSVQLREWRLTVGNNGTMQAEADDLVGTGIGTIEGSAAQMLYKLRLPKESGGHVMDVTDWMYLTENGTIMNRSQFSKFGFKVAELVATMRQLPR